ncbi:hypothetical protein ACTOVN_00325 [Arcanobacterium canis]
MAPGYTGEEAVLKNGRPAAGKTGTANNDYAAWFIGYTPQLATAVWQGHMEGLVSMFNTRINGVFHSEVFGGLYPARAFKMYNDAALDGMPIIDFTTPSDLASLSREPDSSYGSQAKTPRRVATESAPSTSDNTTPDDTTPPQESKEKTPKKPAPRQNPPREKSAPNTLDSSNDNRK